VAIRGGGAEKHFHWQPHSTVSEDRQKGALTLGQAKAWEFSGKIDLVLFGCFCSIGGRFVLWPAGSLEDRSAVPSEEHPGGNSTG
jgi:hypothetical protein